MFDRVSSSEMTANCALYSDVEDEVIDCVEIGRDLPHGQDATVLWGILF